MFEWVSDTEKDDGARYGRARFRGARHETATQLVERFAHIERLGASGKALAARRVANSGAWCKQGDRSAAHWVARTTKTSVGQAVGVLEEARRQGRSEPVEAYAADALVRLAEQGRSDDHKPSPGPQAMVQVLIDHSALTRGYLVPVSARR